jgi:hypothetical protein
MTKHIRIRHTAVAAIAIAGMLLAPGLAVSQNAGDAAPQKTIGQSKTQMVPSLIVLNADSATLEGNTLTLSGVATNSIVFADRPVRSAGHALTSHLLEEWSPSGEGGDSFANNPPNATVSAFSKDGSTIRDAVVVLKSPKLENDGERLTFDVEVLEGDLAGADGPASIFIDIIGLPFTPLSYAGVARRTARRAAWYGAAAAPYYHPYYHPYAYPPPPAYGYPPRPACGYYPYPPCY